MSAQRRARTGDESAATDRFVGRDPELDHIIELLLSSARLITLIGPGGIGKTRLATEAIRRFRKTHRAPVYWVRLARLVKGADADAVEEEAAHAVVDTDFSGRSGWDALVDRLTVTDDVGRPLQSVLVMDNCEHVLEGGGQVIAELLEAVPGLTILATSREAVGWIDEHVETVPALSQQQALDLFRQRAALTGRPIVDRDDASKATLICRHMHNHPLYIRLAAARLSRQPLAIIIRELSGEVTDKRLRWQGPRVGAEPRHRGVGDAIAWSYNLCLDQEKLLLDRMSVFAAGYDTNPDDDTNSVSDIGVDLEAIEAVCADAPSNEGSPSSDEGSSVGLPTEDVEGVLERLVDQSLVTTHITPNTVRYSLLESVRVFAGQRLHEHSIREVDESEIFARRHRQYYRERIIAAQLNRSSPAGQGLLEWVRVSWDNLVTAIETSLTSGEPTVGLEISSSLIFMPLVKGSFREMRRWTERTLRATRGLTPQPTDLQIKAMAMIGWQDLLRGKNNDAEHMLEECVIASLSDPQIPHDWREHPEIDIGVPAPVEFLWAAELAIARRDRRALTAFTRAREKFHALGDHGGEDRSSDVEAWSAGFVGSAEQALQITRRHLDRATASGAKWAKAWAEMARAITLTKYGSPTEALALGRSALLYHLQAHDHWGELWAVHIRMWSLAQIVSDMNAAGSADRTELRALATEIAQLAGGAATLRAALGFDKGDLGPYADETRKAIDVARGMLRPEEFATGQRQGSLLRSELSEVQQLALGMLSVDRLPMHHPARRDSPSHWHDLSSAEQQVATLAAAGWTNSAIATRRGNSGKTIDAQMASIFRKLAITSRGDIIELVPEDQIDRIQAEVAKQRLGTTEKRPRPRPR
ncbi:helix-turn-helix transcriptional regulator [Nocardia sp. CA-107356]|uniref:helix-turn-helix transcriptional regulator n=1 Tax=Nocardia sp. CA-107356 TaxID=3239972 RepID=UPI003D8D350D